MVLWLWFPDENGWENDRTREGNILARSRNHPLRAHIENLQIICNICYGHGDLGTLSLEMNKLTDKEAFEVGLENWNHRDKFEENDGICKSCNGHGYLEMYRCTVCRRQLPEAWHDCEGKSDTE